MLKKFMRKKEIEEILEGKGDFVQINYLENFLKQTPPIEMRKFAYIKLAEIYKQKKMFSSEAEAHKNAALNSVTFQEKQEHYLSEAEAYILAGKFDLSDKALKKAMDEANQKEKEKLYNSILEIYIEQVEKLEKENKKEKAAKIYEKLIQMKISEEDKEKFRLKLIDLYDRLGKTEELKLLKKGND